MADGGGDAPHNVQKSTPVMVSDSPVTDPGSAGKNLECGDGLIGPMSKLDVKTSSALKKSSRYRSRSLSASSTDSYSSGNRDPPVQISTFLISYSRGSLT